MMGNGQPPSTSLRGADSEQLETARGSVRDTLGAIQNVEQLLKSIKVGPKALAAVIPDVHASCAPLLASFRQLLETLADLGDAPAQLERFVTPRILELERALADSLDGPLNAKQRLALESAVSRVAGDLDAARELIELLESTRGAGTVPVQLVEVVRDASTAPEPGEVRSGKTISVTLEVETSRETLLNPRLASRLFRIAVGLVAASDGSAAPHVIIDCPDRGPNRVRISAAASRGESLQLLAPRLIDCTVVCAEAAARATGGTLDIADDHRSVIFTWSPADPGDHHS